MRLTVYLGLLAAGGCTALEESDSTQEIVSAAAPYRNDSPYSIVPDLGVSGTATSASPTATDAASIHEATFSNGVTSKAAVSTDAATWHPLAAGGPGGSWAQFESAPSFVSQLAAAEADATPIMSADDTQLSDIEWLLNHLPISLGVSHPPPTQYFYGWPAVQARWLRAAYAVVNSATGLMANQSYADPSFAAEIRDRGARLFCAARAAAFNQNATHQASMGRQAALTFSIFGHEIQLGVVEPTFRLNVPQKHIGTGADGAQTFEVPLEIGAQITPIGGLGLPGFPELRYPLALVAGDTEVASSLPVQSLHTGDVPFCSPFGGCGTRPLFTPVHPKDYLTVTHADAVRGRAAHLEAHSDVYPLFTMGAFTVTMHMDGGIDVGAPKTGSVPADDRLLTGVPSWWPTGYRTGDLTPSPWPGYLYDDEPWTPTTSVDAAPPALTSFSLPKAATVAQFSASDPLQMRALEDDDHHLQTETSANLSLTVDGDFGWSLGPAHFELKGSGSLGIKGAVQMDVRDGEMALPNTPAPRTVGNPPALTLTALTATPSTYATGTVGFGVSLQIDIPIPFTSGIHETIGIISATAEHTWGGTPWAQPNRALIATGSSYWDPRTQPWAVSHLPYTGTVGTSFPTFPVFNSFDQSVDACLADPATPLPPPPPCQAPPTSAPPHGNVCVFSGSMQIGYGTPASWVGACSAIPSHVDGILGVGAPAAQKQCYVDTLTAICKATSKEQDWRGQHGVAHIINTTALGGEIDIGSLATECASAFAPQAATTTFNRIFEFGACDDSATMIDPDKVVVPTSPPDGTPSPVTAGTCN